VALLPSGRTGGGPDQVELVFDGGQYGVRKRMVSAHVLPVTAVLPSLLSIDPNGSSVPRSLGVWASDAVGSVADFQGADGSLPHAFEFGVTAVRGE